MDAAPIPAVVSPAPNACLSESGANGVCAGGGCLRARGILVTVNKRLTVTEFANLGGRARAEAHEGVSGIYVATPSS